MSITISSDFDSRKLKKQIFHPVIDIGRFWNVLDLTKGYDPEKITLDPPSIGKYNEKRRNMYISGIFGGIRNIHMGIDIWVPVHTPVRAFADGKVLFSRDNTLPGDYGPTVITEHILEGSPLYALFGHLARESLQHVTAGTLLKKGQKFANVGDTCENGGWAPHLHFQLSRKRPHKPDMPGVVSEEDRPEALFTYPDPQLVLGRLY